MTTSITAIPSSHHAPANATVASEVTSSVHAWPGMSQRARLIGRALTAVLLSAWLVASGAIAFAVLALPLWAGLELVMLQRRRRAARPSFLLWRPSGAHLSRTSR